MTKFAKSILALLLFTLTLFANLPQSTYDPRDNKACKNSFDAQTLVATENGLVPIEEIQIGDKVWAYNEANQTKSLQEVTHLIRGEGNKTLTDITLASGEVITATSNHPFWEAADHNWTQAGRLTLDDVLFDIQEQNTTISSLKSYTKNTTVYNLTVANDHTYFVGVGGVLGHNAGCRPPDAGTWLHIFRPNIKIGRRTGNRYLSGFHHYGMGLNTRGLSIRKIPGSSKYGFYKADIYDSSGIELKLKNSMFPDAWSRKRVMRVVNKGYTIAIQKGTNGAVDIPLSSVEGLYYRGIKLRYFFRNNRVISVYPIW